jgi:hypothetical protein
MNEGMNEGFKARKLHQEGYKGKIRAKSSDLRTL